MSAVRAVRHHINRSVSTDADAKLDSALRYINAKRVGVQAELKPTESGWISRANPWEVWSADDVIAEAKRLGWQP